MLSKTDQFDQFDEFCGYLRVDTDQVFNQRRKKQNLFTFWQPTDFWGRLFPINKLDYLVFKYFSFDHLTHEI